MRSLLILSSASGYGGAERNLEIMVAALAERYRIVVLAEHAGHRARLSSPQNRNVTVVRLRRGKGIVATLTNLWIVRGWLSRLRPVTVIANSNKGAFYLALHERILGPSAIRKILFVHDFQWRFVPFIFRTLRDAITLIPTPALLEKESYISRFLDPLAVDGSAKHAVVVFPNLIPAFGPRRLEPGSESSPGSREYVLCLGSLAPLKGLTLLVEAFSSGMMGHPHVHLKICGDTVDARYASELRELIRRLSLEKRVHLGAFSDDPAALYEDALFVVNSSISAFGGPESFGRTIIEAWCFHKPVIAFRAGGPKYLIEHGRDGFLVEEGDVVGLGRRMLELTADKELRLRMGQSGYQKAASCYSPAALMPRLSRLIEADAGDR